MYERLFTIMVLAMLISVGSATDIKYTNTIQSGDSSALTSSVSIGSISTQAYGDGKQTQMVDAVATGGKTGLEWTYNIDGEKKFTSSNFAAYRIRNDQATYRISSWGTGTLHANVLGTVHGQDAIGVETDMKGDHGSITESYHTKMDSIPKADVYTNVADWNGNFTLASNLIIDPQSKLTLSSGWLGNCTEDVNPLTGMSYDAADPIMIMGLEQASMDEWAAAHPEEEEEEPEGDVVQLGGGSNPWLATKWYPVP